MIPNPITDPAAKLLQDQADQIYQKSRVRRYLLYTLFIPPLGLFMAFRGHVLHLVLPSYLAAESVFLALSTIITLISVKPVLELLKFDASGLFSGLYWTALLVVTINLILAGLVLGFYYQHEVKKNGYLPHLGIVLMLLILGLHYLVGFLLTIYVNNQVIQAIGGLDSTLENLYQTEQLLR